MAESRRLHPRKILRGGYIVEVEKDKSNVIKIVIDNNTVEKYKKHYFEIYPRRKVCPIDKPIPPSLNTWMLFSRFRMNTSKQAWKEFGVWIIEDLGLAGKNIKSCIMTVEYFFRTRVRKDPDNFCPKFINDALTETKFLEDDDFLHITTLIIKGNVDKNNPRTELTFEYKEKGNL